MSVDYAHDGCKVEQFQAHCKDYPCNNHAGPRSPRLLQFLVCSVAEVAPENVLNNACGHICRHIVGIVPVNESKIGDMCHVQSDASDRPSTQESGLQGWFVLIQSEDPDWGIEKTIEDTGSGRIVIQLLRYIVIPGMEDHTEEPADPPNVPKPEVVFA